MGGGGTVCLHSTDRVSQQGRRNWVHHSADQQRSGVCHAAGQRLAARLNASPQPLSRAVVAKTQRWPRCAISARRVRFSADCHFVSSQHKQESPPSGRSPLEHEALLTGSCRSRHLDCRWRLRSRARPGQHLDSHFSRPVADPTSSLEPVDLPLAPGLRGCRHRRRQGNTRQTR